MSDTQMVGVWNRSRLWLLALVVCCGLCGPLVSESLAGGGSVPGQFKYFGRSENFTYVSSIRAFKAIIFIYDKSNKLYLKAWGGGWNYRLSAINTGDVVSVNYRYSSTTISGSALDHFKGCLIDSDGDGHRDYWELKNGTDYNDSETFPDTEEPPDWTMDSNNDGMPDRLSNKLGGEATPLELARGVFGIGNEEMSYDEKLAYCQLFAGRDYDGDGVNDLTEIALGFSIYDSDSAPYLGAGTVDSDGDGVYDWTEVIAGTRPDSALSFPHDLNSNGILDVVEKMCGMVTFDIEGQPSHDYDFDNDGTPDIAELIIGTDSQSSDSRPLDWKKSFKGTPAKVGSLPPSGSGGSVFNGGSTTPQTGSGTSSGNYNSVSEQTGDFEEAIGTPESQPFTLPEAPAAGSNEDTAAIRSMFKDFLDTSSAGSGPGGLTAPNIGSLSEWSPGGLGSSTGTWGQTLTNELDEAITGLENKDGSIFEDAYSENPPEWSVTLPMSDLMAAFGGKGEDLTFSMDWTWYGKNLRDLVHTAMLAVWTLFMSLNILEETRRY